MIDTQRLQASFPRAYAAVEPRLVMIRKAFSFAVIGAINAVIDFGVFFISYWYLTSTTAVAQAFTAAGEACHCGTAASLSLIVANVMAWLVAVTCSYVMNSYVTFAAEFGPHPALARLRDLRGVRHPRRHRQHHDPGDSRPVHPGVGRQGLRPPGQLRGELLDVALRGVPPEADARRQL